MAKKKTTKKKSANRNPKNKTAKRRTPTQNPGSLVHMRQALENPQSAKNFLARAQSTKGAAHSEAAMNAFAFGATARAKSINAIDYHQLQPAARKSAEATPKAAASVMRDAQRLVGGTSKNPRRRAKKTAVPATARANPVSAGAARARRALGRI